MNQIRLVVVDCHPVVREGLCAIFGATSDIKVVGKAGDGDAALELVAQLRPQVILMDLKVSDHSTSAFLKKIRRSAPKTAILVLGIHSESHYTASCLRAGAAGFISKTREPRELIEAVRQVAAGKLYISGELAQRLAVESLGGACLRAPHEYLSTREQQVLVKLAGGISVSDIARRLHLSPKTVSTHKTRILQKLELDNISSLVRYAIDHELL